MKIVFYIALNKKNLFIFQLKILAFQFFKASFSDKNRELLRKFYLNKILLVFLNFSDSLVKINFWFIYLSKVTFDIKSCKRIRSITILKT